MHGLEEKTQKRKKGREEVDKELGVGWYFSGVVQFPFAEAKILNSMGSCMGLRD